MLATAKYHSPDFGLYAAASPLSQGNQSNKNALCMTVQHSDQDDLQTQRLLAHWAQCTSGAGGQGWR